MPARGSTYRWQAITKNGLGQVADADDLILSVEKPGGGLADGFPIPTIDIVRDGTGLYHYDWAIPADATTGEYDAVWSGTVDGADVAGTDSVVVTLAGTVSTPSTDQPRAYSTPNRFKTSRMGRRFASTADYVVADALADASAEVDAYCNVPLLPQPFNFLGGRAVDEEHIWRYPEDDWSMGQRRIYPRHWPVAEIESFSMIVDPSANGTSIDPSNLLINNQKRYIELGSLGIMSGGPLGIPAFYFPGAGLTQPVVYITYTYGTAIPVADETLYEVSTNVFQGENGFWTEDGVIVKVDGVIVSDGYEVNLNDGRVTFDDPPGGVVTATYTHRLVREIERATQHIAAYMLSGDALDASPLRPGLQRIRIAEFEATRATVTPSKERLGDLAGEVPSAARLLSGFRFITVR